MSELKEQQLLEEAWREYDFGGRTYRIDNPISLVTRVGGTTHRVGTYDVTKDITITHCVPAPGINGCVLRWSMKDGKVASF